MSMLERGSREFPAYVAPMIQKRVREEISLIFRGEGQVGYKWPALRPRTIREREFLGFPGEHPILIRTYSFFERIMEEVDVTSRGDDRIIILAPSDIRFPKLHGGDPDGRVPPRPVFPVGAHASEVFLPSLRDDLITPAVKRIFK